MSDLSYDVLTALQNKLEALAAYDIYMEDCEETGDDSIRQVFERMRADDDGHVEMLRQTLEKMVREGKFR